ncbi:MAG: type II secretion system protein, partial [Rickettsiales bacterium]
MPHNPLLTPARHGFTLVEMSIVLAIIGVLMGGMLSLQNYTRNAKIKTVMNESKAMISAYNQFQTQYSAIPGDYIAASNAWTGAGNGDGNGVIRATGTNPGNRNEYFYSFQHLSRSGFIAGAYTGTTSGGGGTYYARIGINVPGNAMERGAFLFDHPDVLDGFATADIYYFDGNYGNVLRIASLSD